MSDYYLALVDPLATPANASERGNKLRIGLIEEGIISAETSDECVYAGIGHRPGRRLIDVYVFAEATPDRPREIRYWDELTICGVQFCDEKWVNAFGITAFNDTRCPACAQDFDFESGIMAPLMKAIGVFMETDDEPSLRCPGCDALNNLRTWTTEPHLGICHFAVMFWNWPNFEAKGWKISIPEIASSIMGSPLIVTYGRM